MQEQFFVQFKTPTDLQQVKLVLRNRGVCSPDVELLDADRQEQYRPLLAPREHRTNGILKSILICIVTTLLGLMSVIVEDVGYILSLCSIVVILIAPGRKAETAATQILSVRVDGSDVEAAKSSLLNFGAVAILEPVA